MLLADHAVIPHPRFGVDRLAHTSQQTQPREIVLCRQRISQFHQRPDCRRCRVENRDAMRLADLPESPSIGRHRAALVQDDRGACGKRSIGDVAMPRHPADVRGAPEHIVLTQIKDPFARGLDAQEISTARVLDSLRLAGGSRRVEDIKRMFRVHPFGLAHRRMAFDDVVPPVVPAGDHRDRPSGAPVHDDALNARASAGERLVRRRLQLYGITSAPAAVGRDHDRGTRVLDPILESGRREASEHDRMNRTDPVAGVHRDEDLGNEGHVDHNAVAAPHALRAKRVRESANLRVQLAIAQTSRVAGLTFEDDRRLVPVLAQMNVQTVE